MNTKRIVRTAIAWTSIVYTACFLALLLLPGIRSGFMMYGWHTRAPLYENILTFGTFLWGFVIWDAIAAAGAWLFATLYNKIK